MSQLSSNTLNTLQTVYLDDYNEDKKYYRILFRPATAVQARELTQLQTILQNQIQRFGDHMFKDGSIVDGVHITYHEKVPFVFVKDSFANNLDLSITNFDNNYLLTNSANNELGVRAVIKVAKQGYEATYPATNRFYVDYIKTGKTGTNNDIDVSEFQSGETLYLYSPNQSKLGNLNPANIVDSIQVITANGTANASGYGYGVSVSDGIIYQKGFFSKVSPQTIIVKDYDTYPNNYVIGFDTTEAIVTENQDETLNDNASGFYNYRAPGAHRLKLTPTLIAKLRSDVANNTNFFAIAEFDNGRPTEQNVDPVYNKLGEEFARRTYEESGDYVIKPFQLDSYESADSNTFLYEVSPGIAYVQGHRVELIASRTVEVDRAFTTQVSQNQVLSPSFGNYVVVSEFVGAPSYDGYEEVALYDQPQYAISDKEGSPGGLVGNIIGYANVRDYSYRSGTKGTFGCQYNVYLFNIRMNTGKSFAQVKSLYGNGTNGRFKADIYSTNNIATLFDTTRNTLVYDTGTTGVRRLTNENGVNDTSYVYRQTSTATMYANGYAVFTILTPPAGGVEQLNYGPGLLSDSEEDQFNIFLTANAFTANLTGTINVAIGSPDITGSGTLFQTQLTPGQIIRVGSGTAYYTVNSIASNTALTINEIPGFSYSTQNFQKFYLAGTPLRTTANPSNSLGDNPSIQIISNTQFSITTGSTFDSGSQSLVGQYLVSRTTAVPAKKEIKKRRLVKISCSNNVSGATGPWNLGVVDVAKINAIYVGAVGSNAFANTNPNYSNWFQLDNGQRGDYYDHAKLVIKPQYKNNISSTTTFLVDFDHFVANTSNGKGFFSVDSYPVSNTANSTTINYAEIPVYGNVELRNAVDFRAQKINTANTIANTNPANTSIPLNPATTNNFTANNSQKALLAAVDSTMTVDVEYYLPRRDFVVINKNGDLAVRKGTPKLEPKAPFNDRDTVVLAETYVPPFPSLTVREGESYNRRDISTKIAIKTNKGYTMKDIAALEERIKRLEYYTVLNALEQQARDMTIPDTNGLNRFKNGIFADPFNSHGIGNVSDFEYKISIDNKESIARPYFKTHAVDFMFDSANSINIQRTGSLLTLPYTEELFINQKFATKYRNLTESVWKWNGKVNLYPSYDYFRDEINLPNQTIPMDFTAPWREFANSPFAQNFGDWRTVNVETTVETSRNRGWFFGLFGRRSTTVTTTNTTQQQIVQSLGVDTITNEFNLGSFVSDISIQPYMRSRLVAFVAYNLKPNTTLHAFFDDKNVDASVAPGERVVSTTEYVEGKESDIVAQKGDFGDPLISDANGVVSGIFKIPANEFRVGDRTFRLVDVADLTTGADAILTSGSATYSASNMSVTKQGVTLQTMTPKIKVVETINERVITTVTVRRRRRWFDPLAQSFFIETPDDSSGVFITKLGVYFQAKDPTLGVSCYIVEMRNGFPDISNVVAEGYLESSQVSVSEDGQTETVFTLDKPVILTSGGQYAFIIQPDGDSPEYRIWMGETGGIDIFTGEQVYSNPYSGIAFVSANMNTWTALQKEDVKFNIYRARFTASTGKATFYNEDDEYLNITGLVRINSDIPLEVGDVVYTVNSSSNGVISSNSAPFGIIQYVDEGEGIIHLDSARPGFSNTTNPTVFIYRVAEVGNNSLLTSNNLIAIANVYSVDNINYSVVVPKFASMEPLRTQLNYTFKGTGVDYIVDAEASDIINGYDGEYIDKMRMNMSKSNEQLFNSGLKSSSFEVNFASENDMVSPVVDLSKKASLFIENKINNDSTDEHTRYGNAQSKYISKKVILASGQEAEDLIVYLTAYRPTGTNIEIYAKFRNSADSEDFNSKVWSKLEYKDNGDSSYSNPLDTSNYIEYQFGMPTANLVAGGAYTNAESGVLEYTNNNGELMQGYKEYAIKIVLLSENPAVVPRLNDVRAISLQV